ncbi:LppU/SCO3897 family protein [Nocardia huaxiensis]|uniref:Lipoprotein n=1 Tax=Nocardia huaxiensis TaxID=2755382 RepID=A0A7D6V7U9_9NOCA|nr:hypothetical protein [Nocardia huaxiensis]QLY28471.1 hypothetical protein H0264_24260 [Nocardia huaxiensis]UFS98078.1 hypothetical protein LPY97_09345 [Nocardia huaxiensis]
MSERLKAILSWAVIAVVGVLIWQGCDDNESGPSRVARVGDCVKETGEDSVKKVDCTSSEAQYRVVGELDHATIIGLGACDAYPSTEKFYSAYYTGGSGGGYTLCLSKK